MTKLKIEVTHIMQPPKTKLCGQATLAMVLRITLDEACDLMGHRRTTKTKELIAALGEEALGSRLRPVGSKLRFPDRCVLRAANGNLGHFVYFVDQRVHDPELPGPRSFKRWLNYMLSGGWALRSFLELKPQ